MMYDPLPCMWFQFLIGSLEAIAGLIVCELPEGFQFLIGSLEAKMQLRQAQRSQFQFLIGSLEAESPEHQAALAKVFQFLIGSLEALLYGSIM